MKTKRMKELFKKICYPHPLLLFFLVLISAAGLVFVFASGLVESAAAYILYPLSAYTLTALVFHAVRFFRFSLKDKLNDFSFYQKYRNNPLFRSSISLRVTLAINTLYLVYKTLLSVLYSSAWFFASALYYLILSLTRLLLLKNAKKTAAEQQKTIRLIGVLLMFLTIVSSAFGYYAIFFDRNLTYPGHMIYAAAAFSFYNLISAVSANLKKGKDRVSSASKKISLASALVSLYSLQSAMLAAFGNDAAFADLMNSITGFAVLLLIILLSVFMIRNANKE